MNRKHASTAGNIRPSNKPTISMAQNNVPDSAKNKQLASKRLDENLQKVKMQVGQLVEQARVNVAKQKGSKRPADLEKAKALEGLVMGVNQVISSLEKLR